MTSETVDKTAASPPRPIKPGLVLALCSGATFMAFLDLSVVNIAFPDILADYPGTPMSTLTWVVSAYAIVFAAFLTPAGKLADAVGRHKVFLTALVGFTLASLLCALAPDPGVLVAGRVLQGGFAAAMIPSALALIISSTPFEKLFRAVAAWTAISGFSAVVGPALGGVLVEQFDWRAVFFINVPVGVLLLVGGLRGLPRHAPPGTPFPDVVGTLLLTLGIGGAVAGLTEGDRWGWTDPLTLGLIVGGLVLVGLALARSRRHASPAVEIGLWKVRRFVLCNIAYFVFGAPMFAWLLSGALFTTTIWQWSILESAGALSIGAFASMVTSVIAGRITDQTKHRWIVALGAAMFAACCAMMATDLFNETPNLWGAWVPASLLGGGGLGFAITGLGTTAATSLPPIQFAAGLGMNMTARQVGGALGIASFAALMSADRLPLDNFHALYLACAIAAALAALIAVLIPDPEPQG
ncbi:MFS transporter [Actinocorallia sp. API 0066]|uniref:MFS transporter n=1 Tax=Actinocorallia sp. API 0066 TaxID=2896846 RepID=UPI001E378020|nr:MFS transporter [Actinocorallia sp. API 0066]MCD0453469.1 MFS transporter [Actinocorallia sp. API 0066]